MVTMIFIFVCLIILNITALFIPKKLSKMEIYATSFFALTFGILTDVVLDLYFDLYGYLQEGVQLLAITAQLLAYPSVSLLFLNYYPFQKSLLKKWLYILVWSVFSTLFEWMSSMTAFFYHNGWELWCSAVAYPFIFLILAWNLKFIRSLLL